MRRSKYILSLKIIGAVFIVYILYFFIYTFSVKSKLTTTNDSSLFNITPIIGISKNRINQESITFNQKKIVEYDCIVDSLYAISMVKIGILKNAISEKNVEIRTKNIPEREGYFNYDIATPYPLENIDMYNVPYFNTSILPMEEIQNIEMFVEGDIISKEYINERILAYEVKASRVSFSFNEENKKDLEYIYADTGPSFFYILFCKDKDSNLYIASVSTITGESEEVQKILQLE